MAVIKFECYKTIHNYARNCFTGGNEQDTTSLLDIK